MALFPWGRKKQPAQSDSQISDITETVEPEAPVDLAWQRLELAIESHPLFRLVTFDGLYWIDPFNGELISAPFDLEETIREHFRNHDHWRQGRTRSAVQLYTQRWMLWLEEDAGRDQRLCLFTDDGHWFNPHLRCPSSTITADMAQSSSHFLRRIAQELAQSPTASPHSLVSLEELEVDLGRRDPPAAPAQEVGQGSGIRLATTALPASAEQRPAPVPSAKAENLADLLPAWLRNAAASGERQIVEAVQSLQEDYAVSPQEIQQHLVHMSPGHHLPNTSDELLSVLKALRERLDREQAAESGPTNAEIYNCLISLREERDSTRAVQVGDGSLPLIGQSQLSEQAIEQLMSSLQSISLVAQRLGEPLAGTPSSQEEADEGGIEDPDEESTDSAESPEKPEEDQEWAEDMAKAGAIQGHLLGAVPALSGVQLAIEYRPYTSIGGDFYQVVSLGEDRFFFIVGDVSGHGVQAALIVSSIINSLKIILRRAQQLSLCDIICELNEYMRECLPSGKFFTAFSGIIDTSGEQASLECVCSGHHPTICLNASQAEPIREIGSHGMGIGIVRPEMFRRQIRSDHYSLLPGDVLAIYTDGITETMDENGDELGEILVRCSFFAHMDCPPHQQIQAVLEDIASESDGVLNDDLTVMVIRIE